MSGSKREGGKEVGRAAMGTWCLWARWEGPGVLHSFIGQQKKVQSIPGSAWEQDTQR